MTTLLRRLRRDDGFSAVEVVLLAPLAVMVLLLFALCGRLIEFSIAVNSVASEAARAASIQRDTGTARKSASDVAKAALNGSGSRCANGITVNITENAGLLPGEDVAVDIECGVSLKDLTLIGVGGTINITAEGRSRVETYKRK